MKYLITDKLGINEGGVEVTYNDHIHKYFEKNVAKLHKNK